MAKGFIFKIFAVVVVIVFILETAWLIFFSSNQKRRAKKFKGKGRGKILQTAYYHLLPYNQDPVPKDEVDTIRSVFKDPNFISNDLLCQYIVSQNEWFSKNGVDKFVYFDYFRKKTKKEHTFLEVTVGGNPWKFSNSLFFERCLGWNGVVIEASPKNYHLFKKKKTPRNLGNVKIINKCVSDKESNQISVLSNPGRDDQTEYPEEGVELATTNIKVDCFDLGSILAKVDAEKKFSFVSIGGNNHGVLKGVDLKNFGVEVLFLKSMVIGGEDLGYSDPEVITEIKNQGYSMVENVPFNQGVLFVDEKAFNKKGKKEKEHKKPKPEL